ncbi:class I adenylate-forming enzyme family protein [Niveispirillum sp.]|uniref:class I adenylate-forming enzyme family protein n=1 Tax=Niveispirillum sp. TaxID=1917217 RepID=UPI001B51EF66|nr:AMP-binding protein [Niveispirillum sp.]MBP7335498.1 AMP-binding protein [Niveispirillum sp.]
MDVIHYFDHGVYLAPDRDCLVMDDKRWTYREAQRLTMKVASALRRDGVQEGAKVAVLSPNDPAAFLCVLGAIRAHMVWVPLNPRSSTETLITILEKFECEVLIYNSLYDDFAREAQQKLGCLTRLFCVDKDTSITMSVEQWTHTAPDTFDIAPADPDAVVSIATTSGTTGAPKGVLQTHRFYEHLVSSIVAVMPAETPPHYLAAGPMTHAAGTGTFHTFVRGGTVFVLPAAKPLLIASAITQYGITDLVLPPTVIYGMLAEPTIRSFDYRSLRYFWYGTAPMSPDKVREAIEIFGPCMVSAWGQSEAVCGTFLRSSDLVRNGQILSEKRLASCGRKFPFTDVAVMDPDGRLLGINAHGELVIRSSGLMKGYYEDPQATEEVSRFGWHHTGDVGYFDEEGYFYIVDRMKDMIISGGFNIFPGEIENVLLSHAAVEDCAVIGVPDDKWGERIHAVIQLKSGIKASTEELLDLCRDRLAGMKTPKSLEFREELPRSPVGKTLKRVLRDEYWAGRSRKV